MSELAFSQPARRSFAVPVVFALIVFGAGLGLFLRFTPHSMAEATVKSSAAYTSHLVFKAESRVVGSDTVQNETYVLVTLEVKDRLSLPLFIKDFTATITPAGPDGSGAGSGAEPITTSAVEKLDVPNVYAAFPQLKALADKQGAPLLLRETRIDPGRPVEGMVLVHFPVDGKTWEQRKSASVNLVLYQQDPIVVPIPK